MYEEYQNNIKDIASQLIEISHKREILMLTVEDPVMEETLAYEMRQCIERFINGQEVLKKIQKNPEELIIIMKKLILDIRK